MNKFIISLVAVSLSFGLVAGAQTQDNEQKSKVNLAGIAYPKLATSSRAAKEALNMVKAEREAFQKKMEALKSEFKVKRDQEKAALKTKLQDIKDEAKKVTVQKLDENINKVSSNFVEKFTKNLTDFDTYLSKLVNKASATSTAAKDMTAFNVAVESAKVAIVSARTAVEAQAKQTYSIAISTEANLKSDISSVKNTLNADLKSVRDLVQAAHLATVKALNEFNKIK